MSCQKLLIIGFALILISVQLAAAAPEYSRIGRLAWVEGQVSFQHPGETDWVAASINMALQPGDRVYTGERGRAEIEFDDGSVLRLAEKTDIEILSLREARIQFRLLVGLCSLTVNSGVDFEVNTPGAAFTAYKKGVYRFDVDENGEGNGIVRKGELEVAGTNYSRRIQSGEFARVVPGGQREPVIARYDRRDAWDEWTDRRNADMVAYESRRYLPDYVYFGVRDLDRYGSWISVDGYGPAWVPYHVDAGWSPYWVGRWWYRPAWGWTWISYEPWGWLPYHYGRWHFRTSIGWCWLPGASFGFHFWSPGLVRFYHGPTWVSWAPLGPGDYYNVNRYHYSVTYNHYINNIRLDQRRNPGDLANRHAPGAFRTVSTSVFVSGATDGRGRVRTLENIDRPWDRGRMVTDHLGVQPTSISYQPAPDRIASVPTHRSAGLPAVIRTDPAAQASSAPRFVRAGGEVRPAASAESAGSAPSRTGAMSYREGAGVGMESVTTGGGGAREALRPGAASERSAGRSSFSEPDSAGGRNYQTPQTGMPSNMPRVYGRPSADSNSESGGVAAGRRDSVNAPQSVVQPPPANYRERPAAESRPAVREYPRQNSSPAPPRYEPPAPAPESERPRERPRPPDASQGFSGAVRSYMGNSSNGQVEAPGARGIGRWAENPRFRVEAAPAARAPQAIDRGSSAAPPRSMSQAPSSRPSPGASSPRGGGGGASPRGRERP